MEVAYENLSQMQNANRCWIRVPYVPCYYNIWARSLWKKEKYIFNKYLLSHLIKNSWYSILCFIIVLIRFVIKLHFSGYYIYIILLLCISILTSLFQRKFSKYLQWKYSKDYSEYAVNYTKIVSGGLAVLLSFFLI